MRTRPKGAQVGARVVASAREIRQKIGSVENTRKLTRALELVSAARIRQAENQMRASRPYALHMRRLIAHFAQANNTDFRHPALVDRAVRRVSYLVVSSRRGLCGGLNANLFHAVLRDVEGWRRQGVGVELVAIGRRGARFFHDAGIDVVGAIAEPGDHPTVVQLAGVMKLARGAFMRGEVDRIHLGYNEFVSPLIQRPVIDRLIPLAAAAAQIEATPGDAVRPAPATSRIDRAVAWDYLYEPEAEPVIRSLLHRYFEAMVYQAVLENLASEHAARLVAMRAATDNANRTIERLTRSYHKARQAAITEEIAEIVNGASALGDRPRP